MSQRLGSSLRRKVSESETQLLALHEAKLTAISGTAAPLLVWTRRLLRLFKVSLSQNDRLKVQPVLHWHTNTTLQKFGAVRILNRSLFCSPRLHLIDQKHSKIVKLYYNSKQAFSMWIYVKMSFISVMRSCIFSIITPVFSVTWSSEIIIICWFAAQETFLIIINVENYGSLFLSKNKVFISLVRLLIYKLNLI